MVDCSSSSAVATQAPSGPVDREHPWTMSADDLAQAIGVDVRSIWRWTSSGALPAPVRLGGRTFWQREEVTAWFNAGCPKREKWQRVWKVG
jgi:predicted DNA-binding transcriptional regulator AlpA